MWVLEVNDHPSLNIYHDTEFMGGRKLEDSDICPVDYHVKSQLICDTVALARKTHEKIAQTEDYGCLHRIHPSADQVIFPLVCSLQDLFYKLCKVSDKRAITSTRFELLMNAPCIKNCGFAKVDLSLTF